jgi:HJR/Mrr/RecB family endonuclease
VRGWSAKGLSGHLVPAGETPWLWWLGAALWLLVWPAVIALKASGRGLSWLPWWLPLILATAHMLILAGPVLYSKRAASASELRWRFSGVRTLAEMLALEPGEFEAWIAMLFQLTGYRVRNTQDAADHGIDLWVSDDRLDSGLVQCKRYRGTVGEPTVRDLYGTMIHENASYGWLVTTGAISRQAREWVNGKPIELWDGQRLVDLAAQLR